MLISDLKSIFGCHPPFFQKTVQPFYLFHSISHYCAVHDLMLCSCVVLLFMFRFGFFIPDLAEFQPWDIYTLYLLLYERIVMTFRGCINHPDCYCYAVNLRWREINGPSRQKSRVCTNCTLNVLLVNRIRHGRHIYVAWEVHWGCTLGLNLDVHFPLRYQGYGANNMTM